MPGVLKGGPPGRRLAQTLDPAATRKGIGACEKDETDQEWEQVVGSAQSSVVYHRHTDLARSRAVARAGSANGL
jgi:hypothetical protein